MATVKMLSEGDLRESIRLDLEAVDCIEQAFRSLATSAVVMPPVLRLDIEQHRGEVDVKTAYIPGLDSFAIKVSPGFFDNPKLGLPSLNGLMVLLSSRTGLPEAILLDNGYLTAIRTAAAGAVAARWLARLDAGTAAVLGAGQQARLQLQALTLVRPIRSATVWARQAQQASLFAQEMSPMLGIPILARATIDEAVSGADIIITATPGRTPLIGKKHLSAGLHITAMGSDAEHKNEIAPAALGAVTQYVCDRLAQVRVLGELHHAINAGTVEANRMFPELGQVIAGQHTGRQGPDDITLCDLTGLGVQDTAIATLAYTRCQRLARGTTFES